jgi:hypothetical protein
MENRLKISSALNADGNNTDGLLSDDPILS